MIRIVELKNYGRDSGVLIDVDTGCAFGPIIQSSYAQSFINYMCDKYHVLDVRTIPNGRLKAYYDEFVQQYSSQ